MKQSSTRRKLLATLGTTSVAALTGCSGSGTTGNTESSPTETTTKRSSKNQTQTSTKTPQSRDAPYSRGELVEDFEDFENARWGTIGGTISSDGSNPYAGSQSLRLENKNGDVAGIFKSFPDGLDLTKNDLSIAVKMEKPARGKFSAEVIAPARSDMLASNRFLVKELDGWVRIDLGYTGRQGDPILKEVQELRLMVLTPEGEPIKVWIDDLRVIPKPDRGAVMFHFDDNVASQYDVAFKELQERKWPGAVSIIPDTVNSEGRLTTGQMREMRDAGWDMMSHPHQPKPFPAYSPEKQREELKRAKRYLELKGFPDGARHFVAPYNRLSTETVEILKEVGYETGFSFGACPNNALQPSGMYTISRVQGTDPRGVRRLLNIAEAFNQLVVVYFHSIGQSDSDTSMNDFMNILDHVEKKDIDVITPSQLIDKK
ncbi:polysaccharide deacetylase family protein [Halogranum rubrum]|uniref:NodB homology domain-containing protein n=1 Tax=Halogranum salarium B-1 TaxID=1210908 RepID=J2Z8Q5_9EURY|nr:polysaccharide deacetylase family protein [Halogranum salarium]EJN57005.1 hypothetical protein HSB1_48220 [Halogranum salarium B-1]